MDYVSIIGFVAGFLTTFSSIPAILKVIRMKEARDLSYVWMSMLFIGGILWVVYGFYINALPVIATNLLSVTFMIILILLKIRYK